MRGRGFEPIGFNTKTKDLYAFSPCFFTMGEIYKYIQSKLKFGRYLSTPRNNKLVLEFLKAKFNGSYERLVFEKKANSPKTLIKKAMNIKKIDQYFKKDFDRLTESEILKYRDLMNDNKIFCDKTLIKWKDGKSYFEIIPTKKPLSYRTKVDYKSNFNEFCKFAREYVYQESKKEIPDIMRYFKLTRPEDFEEVVVEFIPDDELHTLLNNIRNRHFKAFVQQSIMAGTRPCEAIRIKYGKNLYKNKQGRWVIHLPKIKGVSFKKFPIVIDMYEDELIPYYESLKLKKGDLVFKFTEATIRKLMKHYTNKYLRKSYSPKILRKTARMIRTNAGYSEQWINKLMGHSASSRVQGAYVDHNGIKDEPLANEKLKAQQYPGLKKDYRKLRLELKAQEQRHNEEMEQLKKMIIEKAKGEILKNKSS